MSSKRRIAQVARSLTARAWIVGAGLAAMGMVAAPAQAIVIDLNPTELFFGPAFSQDGFTVTSSQGATNSYVNWNIYSATHSPNANGDNPTVAENYANSFNTLTQDSGAPFSFQSIALADVFNQGKGYAVDFIFNYFGGGSSAQTVTLESGLLGLQYFTFDQTNLESVVFQAVNPPRTFANVQFDFLGVNGVTGAVPEPATWALMIVGFGAVGATMRRRRTKTVSYA
jgi:hypothetical protein